MINFDYAICNVSLFSPNVETCTEKKRVPSVKKTILRKWILVIKNCIGLKIMICNHMFKFISTYGKHVSIREDVFCKPVPQSYACLCNWFASVFNLVIISGSRQFRWCVLFSSCCNPVHVHVFFHHNVITIVIKTRWQVAFSVVINKKNMMKLNLFSYL